VKKGRKREKGGRERKKKKKKKKKRVISKREGGLATRKKIPKRQPLMRRQKQTTLSSLRGGGARVGGNGGNRKRGVSRRLKRGLFRKGEGSIEHCYFHPKGKKGSHEADFGNKPESCEKKVRRASTEFKERKHLLEERESRNDGVLGDKQDDAGGGGGEGVSGYDPSLQIGGGGERGFHSGEEWPSEKVRIPM